MKHRDNDLTCVFCIITFAIIALLITTVLWVAYTFPLSANVTYNGNVQQSYQLPDSYTVVDNHPYDVTYPDDDSIDVTFHFVKRDK